MKNKNNDRDNIQNKVVLPETYEKPSIKSEKLLAFAASCNGSNAGGRKATVSGPVNFCRANRLNS